MSKGLKNILAGAIGATIAFVLVLIFFDNPVLFGGQ